MKYANSLLDLIGNTPLVRLQPHGRRHRVARAGQGRVPQPRRFGEGPDRRPDDRRRRGQRRAASPAGRSWSRPRATPASVSRSSPSSAATAASSSAPTRSARTSATCSRRTAPRSWSARRPSPPTTRTATTATSDRLVRETEGAWKPDQYSNPNNPRSHYEQTGPEIWEQTDGRITHFVTGMGTGGTISGVGRYLKERSAERGGPDVQVIGADPAGSVYSGGTGRPYLVEGVGRGLLARHLRPRHRRPGHRGLRRRLLRDDAAPGAGGGAAGRRLLRHGGPRGDPARPGARRPGRGGRDRRAAP